MVASTDVIVVEGIFALHDIRLVELMDLKIFV
jgi:uridine kinase